MRYFVIGFMGSGKTHWGKQWGEAFGITYYDLDEEIEKKEGKTIAAIFEEKGETAFRKMEKEMLQSFSEKDAFLLSCGGGTPCFHHNMEWMNNHGVTIYLKSNAALLAQRLQNEKATRPLIAGLPDHLLEEHINEKLKQREEFYTQAMYHLPAQYISTDNFQKIIRRHG